jgi:hypothetical protein
VLSITLRNDMMISADMIAAGVAGAVTDRAVGRAEGAIAGPPNWRAHTRERFAEFLECAERVEKHLKEIAENTRALKDKPVQLVLILQPAVFIPWNTFDKAYNLLFLGSESAVVFDIPGLGQVSLNLSTGWNAINLPQGTLVGLASTASSNVHALFRATNIPFGNIYG